MSATVSYKCPNCGGGLVFDPAKQQFVCEYCATGFTEQQLQELAPAQAADRVAAPTETAGAAPAATESGEAVVYSCPSCGAEVVTDPTTAATFCYYCHNPVVLQGKLSGDYLPDKVIPFTIDHKAATDRFLEWVGKKWFVPPAFFCKKQIEKLSGVYLPHWVTDVDAVGQLDTSATIVRVWRSGDTEHTETKHYQIRRAGTLHFEDIETVALQKAEKKLIEGVSPFDGTAMKPFSIGYLSGFLAEKRDIDKEAVQPEVTGDVNRYTDALLTDTISGYTTVMPATPSVTITDSHWDYVMMPVWMLTYRGRDKKTYVFAMNGQTGKIYGELPLDFGRLALLFGAVALSLFAILLIGGLLL